MCLVRDRLTIPERNYMHDHHHSIRRICHTCLQNILYERRMRWWRFVFHGHLILDDPILVPRITECLWERFASNNVDVDIATHSGSHVDEDAGADADPIVYDLNEELYAISSSSFRSRSMGATRKPWDDANGFLMMISLQL